MGRRSTYRRIGGSDDLGACGGIGVGLDSFPYAQLVDCLHRTTDVRLYEVARGVFACYARQADGVEKMIGCFALDQAVNDFLNGIPEPSW